MTEQSVEFNGKNSSKPKAKKRRRSRVFDFFLGYFGVCLAALSAYLPFYVYNNDADFGPPRLEFTGRQDFGVGEEADEEEVAEARRPLFRDGDGSSPDENAIDEVITGSIGPVSNRIPSIREELNTQNAARVSKQPFPELKHHESFALVFASRGRALIQDGADLLPVAVGSRLPDGSTVKSISKYDGGWNLLTSENRVLPLGN